MERIERAKIKAKIQSERWDSKIKRLEQAQSDEEVRLQNERREKLKLQDDIDHYYYKLRKQEEQDLKNEADTPEAKTRECFRHAKEIRDRDISRGLTKEQRDYKYMDWKMRRDCDNAIAQGEAKDIRDFLKKQRLKEEQRERRRRKLKGI